MYQRLNAEDTSRPVFFPIAEAFRDEIKRIERLAGQAAKAWVFLIVLDVVPVEAFMNALLPAFELYE